MTTPVNVVSPDAGIIVLGQGTNGRFYPLAVDNTGQLLGVGGGGGSSTQPAEPAVVARTVHLASAALPAAGAYSAQALYAPGAGLSRYIAFWITYTRGTANGRPKFKVEWSNGTETAATELVIDETLTTSAPSASQNAYLSEILGPAPANGSAVTYLLVLQNNVGATGVRLLAAEAGVVGTPGTCAIAITGVG
jgi:hypothetical protein